MAKKIPQSTTTPTNPGAMPRKTPKRKEVNKGFNRPATDDGKGNQEKASVRKREVAKSISAPRPEIREDFKDILKDPVIENPYRDDLGSDSFAEEDMKRTGFSKNLDQAVEELSEFFERDRADKNSLVLKEELDHNDSLKPLKAELKKTDLNKLGLTGLRRLLKFNSVLDKKTIGKLFALQDSRLKDLVDDYDQEKYSPKVVIEELTEGETEEMPLTEAVLTFEELNSFLNTYKTSIESDTETFSKNGPANIFKSDSLNALERLVQISSEGNLLRGLDVNQSLDLLRTFDSLRSEYENDILSEVCNNNKLLKESFVNSINFIAKQGFAAALEEKDIEVEDHVLRMATQNDFEI